MSDDRGQALILVVLALAIAAVTIVGLRAAQDRIFEDARDRRAGEAAVEAAGAEVADAYVAFVRSFADDELRGRRSGTPTRADIERFASDPRLADRARAAADRLAEVNGATHVRDVGLTVTDRAIDIALGLAAHRHRAAIDTACCRP